MCFHQLVAVGSDFFFFFFFLLILEKFEFRVHVGEILLNSEPACIIQHYALKDKTKKILVSIYINLANL